MTGIHKTSLVSHKFLTFWYSTVIDMKVVKIMCVCVCVCVGQAFTAGMQYLYSH